MPGLHDTAYPRFKKRIHRKELEQIYTPTREEIILARNEARGETAVVCYLILLKTLQRLGYFVRLKQVPTKIIYHIAGHLGYETLPDLSYVDTLYQILLAYQDNEDGAGRDIAIGAIIGDRKDSMIKDCEDHALYAGKNYFPLLWRYHVPHRRPMLDVICAIPLVATTQDDNLIQAIEFIKYHQRSKRPLIDLTSTDQEISLPDMSWISERWQMAIFSKRIKQDRPETANRQYLELCIFFYLMLGLKSGNICIAGSDQFSDYRTQLVDWTEYKKLIGQYGLQVELPVEANAFVNHTRVWLRSVAQKKDASFPDNEYMRIERGQPIITRVKKENRSQGVDRFEAAIAQRLEPVWWVRRYRLLSRV